MGLRLQESVRWFYIRQWVNRVVSLWYSSAVVAFPEFRSNDFPLLASRAGKRQRFPLRVHARKQFIAFLHRRCRVPTFYLNYTSRWLDARSKARNRMKNKRRGMIDRENYQVRSKHKKKCSNLTFACYLRNGRTLIPNALSSSLVRAELQALFYSDNFLFSK